MRRIIALSGAKGSGKTTAFDLIKKHRPDAYEVTFAGKLKEVCAQAFNIPLETFHRPDLKEKPFKRPLKITSRNLLDCVSAFGLSIPLDQLGKQSQTEIDSPRKLLQFIGTNVLNKIDPNVHMDNLLNNLPESGIIVVTDMRFMTEFERLTGMGANVYHIDNERAEDDSKHDNHPSELQRHAFKDKCVRLDNNGSFEDLEKKIQEIL